MSQTYQLSKSGIERLERFKRDVLAGEVSIKEDQFNDGSFFCFIVGNSESVACCFNPDKGKVIVDIERQFENTVNGKIEKNKFGYYVTCGFALMKSDVNKIN